MMGSIRNHVPLLVVTAFILPCLLMGPVSAAEYSFLFPVYGGEDYGLSGQFLVLEEAPLAVNGTDETVDPVASPEPADPTELPETPDPTEIAQTPEPETPVEETVSADPGVTGGPDFAITGLRVPASVDEQSTYEISFEVENLGDSYAGDIPWEVEFRGDILDALEKGVIRGLDHGGRVTVSVELMADVLVDACDKGSVSVVVDPDELTGDVDYGNNAAHGVCEILGMPEFTLTDLFAPTDVYEGSEVQILFHIANYGSACTGDVDWEVKIRCNDHARDDVVLTGALAGLGEDEEERIIAIWETSPGDAGEYTISAVVTTPDDESDDNEEICELRVAADGDLPDLAIIDPHIPEILQPGVEFPVVFTVENLGVDCAEDIRYDLVYYNERTGEDIWRGDVIRGLARGESVEITDNWTAYHEGDYWIDIYLDESNRIEELTEDNNNNRIVYRLPAGIAGLCAYGNGVPDTLPVVAGETFTITFTVVNVGEDYDGVIDWNIRIYNDNGDEAELNGTIQGILWGWDEGKSVETSWEVPAGWSGEYHTVLDLNPDDRPEYVFEPWENEGNFTVIGAEGSGVQSNLTVTDLRCPPSVMEKDTAVFEWDVTNVGDENSGPFTSQLMVGGQYSATYHVGGSIVGSYQVDDLQPGEKVTMTGSWTPDICCSGQWQIVPTIHSLSIDLDVEQPEMGAYLDVLDAPTGIIDVRNLSVREPVHPGDPIPIAFELVNRGEDCPGEILWGYYMLELSVDDSGDFTDEFSTEGLKSGEIRNIEVEIPGFREVGKYYLEIELLSRNEHVCIYDGQSWDAVHFFIVKPGAEQEDDERTKVISVDTIACNDFILKRIERQVSAFLQPAGTGHPASSDPETATSETGMAMHTNITFGTPESNTSAYAIIPAGDDGYLIAGETEAFGFGGMDGWLVRLNATFEELWNRPYGGIADDAACDVIEDSNGDLVFAGMTTYTTASERRDTDAWVVKVNRSGDVIFDRSFGGSGVNASVASLAETPDGGYLVAGETEAVGTGVSDALVIKLNRSGGEEWRQHFGGNASDRACAAAIGGDGAYLIAGSTESSGAGAGDAWILNVDPSGNEVWNRTYGGAGMDEARAVIALPDGYAFAGSTAGTGGEDTDAWLVRIDGSGGEIWNATSGGTGLDGANALIEDVDGNFLLAGYYGSNEGAVDLDAWVLKYNASGTEIESQTFDTGGDERAFDITNASANEYVVAGSIRRFLEGFGEDTDAWVFSVAGDT